MGGKIASAKSTLFSNNSKVRTWLARKLWSDISCTVPVVGQFRDLGSSMSLGAACSTHLSRKKLETASRSLHRVFALPHGMPQKLDIMRATCTNTALYSCEASHVDEAALTSYSASIVPH